MSQEEIEVEAIGIEVSAHPVELYKVLKIANAVSGGGEAKMAIVEGYVAVNGEVETRKRRKIHDGDVIEFNEEFYVLLCDAPPTLVEPREKKPQVQSKPQSPKQKQTQKQAKSAPAKKASPKKTDKKAASKLNKSANLSLSASAKKVKSDKPAEDKPQNDATTGRSSISF
ncbi:RNA-binding S4 domain-containing protein [Enterovibrio sp. 27052020O]|uniref:RNA-binding S4 domain-containing protein n=1 Tax=Enterovibrio sp. 27052020O TaxID=3241166 RepID=UPI003890D5FA